MNKTYKRQTKRLEIKDDTHAVLSFEYMGKKLKATPKDISLEGIGFIVGKESHGIIDYEYLNLRLSTPEEELVIPSRIIYSYKVGASGRVRRYGASFLINSEQAVNGFLKKLSAT